jgi:hypothetical protein
LIGVAQLPVLPLESLTPVKNSPTTTLSTVISSRSVPRMAPIVTIVSLRIELLFVCIDRIAFAAGIAMFVRIDRPGAAAKNFAPPPTHHDSAKSQRRCS